MNRCAREEATGACATRSFAVAQIAVWSALVVLLVGSTAQAGLPTSHGTPSDIAIRFAPGVYYPSSPYYSRAYLQAFELRRGQNPLILRLAPLENYARFRLGDPVPGLTDGTVDSNVFPYRYGPGFRMAPIRGDPATTMGPPPPNLPFPQRGGAVGP